MHACIFFEQNIASHFSKDASPFASQYANNFYNSNQSYFFSPQPMPTKKKAKKAPAKRKTVKRAAKKATAKKAKKKKR